MFRILVTIIRLSYIKVVEFCYENLLNIEVPNIAEADLINNTIVAKSSGSKDIAKMYTYFLSYGPY